MDAAGIICASLQGGTKPPFALSRLVVQSVLLSSVMVCQAASLKYVGGCRFLKG